MCYIIVVLRGLTILTDQRTTGMTRREEGGGKECSSLEIHTTEFVQYIIRLKIYAQECEYSSSSK